MAMWSEFNSMLEVGYRIFQVSSIPCTAKARFECTTEVVEPRRHVCMPVWSELDGTLEVGYCIFQVDEIPSTAEARLECAAEVAEP